MATVMTPEVIEELKFKFRMYGGGGGAEKWLANIRYGTTPQNSDYRNADDMVQLFQSGVAVNDPGSSMDKILGALEDAGVIHRGSPSAGHSTRAFAGLSGKRKLGRYLHEFCWGRGPNYRAAVEAGLVAEHESNDLTSPTCKRVLAQKEANG